MLAIIAIKGDASAMNYAGGKNGCGVYQQIINQMPPHETYIEAFLGSGAIIRRKRPASKNIGIEKNMATIAMHDDEVLQAAYTVINDDAISILKKYKFTGRELVYCDPPYMLDSRKGGKIYKYEYSDNDHIILLELLKSLPCMVIISGYWSKLYEDMLNGWRTHTYDAQTRCGVAKEWLWMNYQEPDALHDYRFIGDNFRERERIKRKAKRWVNRLDNMPKLERIAILSQLASS